MCQCSMYGPDPYQSALIIELGPNVFLLPFRLRHRS